MGEVLDNLSDNFSNFSWASTNGNGVGGNKATPVVANANTGTRD